MCKRQMSSGYFFPSLSSSLLLLSNGFFLVLRYLPLPSIMASCSSPSSACSSSSASLVSRIPPSSSPTFSSSLPIHLQVPVPNSVEGECLLKKIINSTAALLLVVKHVQGGTVPGQAKTKREETVAGQ